MQWRLRLGYVPFLRPAIRATQRIPRWQELGSLATYRRAAQLHQQLVTEGYTILAQRRARALFRLAQEVERDRVPGLIVDCGVWNGGSTLLMALGAPSRVAWAFDSFEGMPEPRAELDGKASLDYIGSVQGSEEKLLEGFKRYADPKRVHVAKGWFEDSFPHFSDRLDSIALLHIDADWYESVRLALETFYPKVSPGGYVLIDDYRIWPGARKAVDEYRDAEGIEAPMVAGHYWQKPSSANQ